MQKSNRLLKALWGQASRHHSDNASREATLLRDFIHEQLYGTNSGYFNQAKPLISPLTKALDFKAFLGKADYLSAVAGAHEHLGVSWLTPSEIFTPHYGQAVAAHILQEHRKDKSAGLQIFEIGAGTGTLALDVLDFLKMEDQEAYQSCLYTSCEISPVLADQQGQRIAETGRHKDRFAVEVRDAAEESLWGPPNPDPCFILGMEVLDNCPHDKIVKSSGSNGWLQEEVVQDRGKHKTLHVPIQDPLIEAVLASALGCEAAAPPLWERLYDMAVGYPSRGPYSMEDIIFLPTKAASLFKTLQTARPNHHLIMADFSSLPDVQIRGRLAPLVTSKAEGSRAVDSSTYLVSPGSADIVFPSDFELLSRLYTSLAGSSVSVHAASMTTADFMGKYADKDATSARNGYNPLLEDFSNTSFLIGRSKAKSARA